MDLKNKVILTGVKPTGTLHIGNYFGAIKPAIELGHQVHAVGGTHVMFVADYHAVNFMKDAAMLAQMTREIAAAYLALGLNPEQSLFYRQSDVPELFEFTVLLNNFTPKGFMNKAHGYKAAVDKNIAKGEPQDAGINMGLYTYPILMAADILAYDTDMVPVGKDQVQHVEIAADIAGAINACYGKQVLKIPQYLTQQHTEVLPGTEGRKMSKSYGNVIPLFGTDAELKKAVMGIKTDCQDINVPKNPDEILLFEIVRGVLPTEQVNEIEEGLRQGGMGYGTIKKMLLAGLIEQLTPLRDRYDYYMTHYEEVEAFLDVGATKARSLVRPVLNRFKDTVLGRI